MILCKKYDKKDNPIPLVENEFSDQLKDLLKATEKTSWTFSDNSKTTLAGKDYTYFTGSAVLPSSKTGIAQKNFIRKINNNMIVISLGGADEAKIAQLEALFEKNRLIREKNNRFSKNRGGQRPATIFFAFCKIKVLIFYKYDIIKQ